MDWAGMLVSVLIKYALEETDQTPVAANRRAARSILPLPRMEVVDDRWGQMPLPNAATYLTLLKRLPERFLV